MQGGLTPWIDDVGVSLVHEDGTQDEEVMLELSKLEELLHFKTTFRRIIVGHYVPPDPYRNT